MRFFVTGSAGFIGFHLCRRLLADGHVVHGFDGMTQYYDIRLKQSRLDSLAGHTAYVHTTAMLEDFDSLSKAAEAAKPDVIIHLAAQAGVRYSLENPRAYADSNLMGSFNVLEVARVLSPRHLLLASTSSVYGANTKIPFEETDKADEPLTLYAATKKSMEAMAHAYAHLWRLPTTVFRFFTVFGPYGRPDMALFKFVDAAERGDSIDVYAEGKQTRDFTYIDDLIEAVVRLVDVPPEDNVGPHDSLSPVGPYRVVNIGGGRPTGLIAFVDAVEHEMGAPIKRILKPAQKGDVPHTSASPALLQKLTGFVPATALADGIKAFVDWYRARPR